MAPSGLFGFGDAVESPPAPHDALDMMRRAVATDRKEPLFRLGRGNAGECPDLRVRELAARERLRDPRQRREGAGHADMLTRRARRQADAPRQPVSTGAEAVAPAAAFVKLADEVEQPCSRGIEMSRQLGDLLTEALELDDVRRRGSEARSDIHRRVLLNDSGPTLHLEFRGSPAPPGRAIAERFRFFVMPQRNAHGNGSGPRWALNRQLSSDVGERRAKTCQESTY